MSITVHIPSPLRDRTEGAASVLVPDPGGNVASALEALFEIHPGLRDRLLTERSRLRPHVALFVGTENVRTTGGLDTPVDDGSEITVVPAVSGG